MTLAAEIEEKVSAAGFLVVGSFVSQEDCDFLGLSLEANQFANVFMIGSAGSAFWQFFQKSPEFSDKSPDPMDRFTRRVLTRNAGELGLQVLFPFDGPPYFPFQRWAAACGGFSQSPLGVLAHETYGPWLGLRAAFVASGETTIPKDTCVEGPCVGCLDKPCLSICPVGAISAGEGYDYSSCRSYLKETPDAACWNGCLARRACPYGQSHAHNEAQARFHMASFVRLGR